MTPVIVLPEPKNDGFVNGRMVCQHCDKISEETQSFLRGEQILWVCSGCHFRLGMKYSIDGRATNKGPQTGKKQRTGTLSSVVDALLLEGEKTIKEMIAEVAKSEPAKTYGPNKKFMNNVYVRINMLRKKGYTLVKDEDKVKMVKK